MEDGLSKRERVGLNVRRGRASRAAELIVHAEQSGVSTAWMTMGAMGSDTLTLYAAAAVETETIKLGTSIIPAFTREPFTIATQVLVLDDIAPGRLLLGVGISHGPTMGGIYGVPFDRPLSRLREYLQVLRPVLHDGEVEFRGEFYSVRGRLPGAPGTPVLISALGPKSFETAGRADRMARSPGHPIDYMHETALPAMERAAREKAGRERPDLVAHISIAFADTRARKPSKRPVRNSPLQPDALLPEHVRDRRLSARLEQRVQRTNCSISLYSPATRTASENNSISCSTGFDRVIAMPGFQCPDRTGEEQRLIELLGRL
ncbi:MAG: LLM class flavin-dependent oxidoreductase [Thermomicrobiales bacterium]